MIVAVTGATGFVGRVLCQELLTSGHVVRALVRSDSPNIEALSALSQVEILKFNSLSDSSEWESLLSGCDVVIHLAARVHQMNERVANPLQIYRDLNRDFAMHVARCAAKVRVHRFVFLSTVKVNGESSTGVPFNESLEPRPSEPYGISKWEAEQGLFALAKKSGIEVVVVRPPLVYGPGVKANFLKLIRVVDKGLPLPLGAIRNRRDLVFVRNLSSALIFVASSPNANGRAFFVSDGKSVSSPELVETIAHALDRKPNLWKVPPWLLRAGGACLGRSQAVERLMESLELNTDLLRQELGWTPPYSFHDGIRETVEWYRKH